MERKLIKGQFAVESIINAQDQGRVNQFTNILNSCAINMNKTINNLAQEVWDLQAKEQNELIETVNSLKEERNELIETVNCLKAKFSLIETPQTKVDSHEDVLNFDTQESTPEDEEILRSTHCI